ncbi:MAG TPA: class I SAM-dependent methyltransferase [Acidimicrobiales bacterium]|nr:class I SAM-dependent methyltransferase [Acidimicrobiales bacterium]
MTTESPYPELKKTHIAERVGRPWRDNRPPAAAPVWSVIEGYTSYWMLVAAIDLGVFDSIAEHGPATGDELAVRLGACSSHLVALLDALVALGFLDRMHERFELTDVGERYLTSMGPATMAALVAVAPGPHANWIDLADTVRHGSPRSPVDDDAVAFYRPLVRATFPTQHRVAARTAALLGWARQPGAPRVLDLGAGGAPWAIALLQQHPAASAVVNDLPGVVEEAVARAVAAGVDDRVEVRSGNYYELDLDDGAFDVVVLGHVCRAEGEDGSRRLIERAWSVLRSGGRLLLADYFLDNSRRHNVFGALMGVTMIAATERGRRLTHEDAHRWLRSAGFRSIRLLEPIRFNQLYVATKSEVVT